MDIRDWFDTRSFRHQDFEGIGPHSGQTTTLILPSRNVADTIGPILTAVAELRERTGLIDQVLVNRA